MNIEILSFINFIGGLALFLLSMDFLAGGMKRLSGNSTRKLLLNISKTKVGGVIFGFFFTLLFQSSSAATVVLVGFIEVELLTLKNSLPILLGAGVGTTIAAQLISLNVSTYSLIIVALGVFPYIFGKNRVQSAGKVVLSIGLIFFSIKLMSESLEPFKNSSQLLAMMEYVKNPLFGALIGLTITALIHSSAGFIGLLIVLGHNQLIDFQHTLPLLIGANIGTTATAHLAAIKSTVDAKKMAMINTLFRLLISIFAIITINQWESVTIWFSGSNSDIARKIANAHTIFNIAMVAILLPFTNKIFELFNRFWKPKMSGKLASFPEINDELFETPQYLSPFLKKQIGNMFLETERMMELAIEPFISKSEKSINQIIEQEKIIDFYKVELSKVILRVNTMQDNGKNVCDVYVYLHIVNELEQMADIVSVNIVKLAKKWINQDAKFSVEGEQELLDYHKNCLDHLKSTSNLFTFFPYKTNSSLKPFEHFTPKDNFGYNLEISHYERLLSKNDYTSSSSEVHIELLNQLRIINGRIVSLARILSQ